MLGCGRAKSKLRGGCPGSLVVEPCSLRRARAEGRSQPTACAQGPIQNLNDHLASPFVNNGFANATKCAPRSLALAGPWHSTVARPLLLLRALLMMQYSW